MLTQILGSPVLMSALAGALTAARVDYIAFQGFKSFHDAAEYQWSIAAWRWLQGAVIGAVTARELGMGWSA